MNVTAVISSVCEEVLLQHEVISSALTTTNRKVPKEQTLTNGRDKFLQVSLPFPLALPRQLLSDVTHCWRGRRHENIFNGKVHCKFPIMIAFAST